MLEYDIKFLTSDDSLNINKNDFKSFRYEVKKKSEESVYDAAKRNFYERRGGQWRACRPRQIRQLESKLQDRNIILCEWASDTLIVLIFSSGAIAYVSVKKETLDVTQILFDRYCVGKLSGHIITSAVLCKSHLLFIHNEKIATLMTFGKNTNETLCRIKDKDPHIQSIELGGSSRRIDRHVSWRETNAGIKLLVWSPVANEPAPWSPGQEDRANLHLYQIHGQQMSLLSYHQIENETLTAVLSQVQDNIVHIVEQTGCHKKGVSICWSQLSASAGVGSLTARGAVRVSLGAAARAARLLAAERRLLLASLDGALHLLHPTQGLTHSTRAGFIATDVRWSGELIIAAEDGGRIQCFDRALTLLNQHTKCLDLSSYLKDPRRMHVLATHSAEGCSVILVSFVGGPLTVIRVRHPELISAWLRVGRTNNAIALLRTLDWDSEGVVCLRTVSRIIGRALRADASEWCAGSCEGLSVRALGAWLAPRAPHSSGALRRAPAAHDLARKLHHHLLRRCRIEAALSLGVDLEAWDLFADVHWAARRAQLHQAATEARAFVQHYTTQHESECSDSCSQCSSHSSSTGSNEETGASSGPAKSKPPPLPRLSAPHSVVPVNVAHAEQSTSTHSIRPSLHQYIDRDCNLWSAEVITNGVNCERYKPVNGHELLWRYPDISNDRFPTLNNAMSDTIKTGRAVNMSAVAATENRSKLKFLHPLETNDNKSRYYSSGDYIVANDRILKYDNNNSFDRVIKLQGEKNKVKFSDTVAVTVMPEVNSCPSPSRELAESLPLCAPHNFLAAFTPRFTPPSSQIKQTSYASQVSHPPQVSHPSQVSQPPQVSHPSQVSHSSSAASGTALDYVEV